MDISLDVICPGCKGVFHETTGAYDPDKQPTPEMCQLKEPYRLWKWEDFGNLRTGAIGDMVCPQCGYQYAQPGGRLMVKGQAGEQACPVCGKTSDQFKTKSAFEGHKRWCKGKS